MLRIHTNIYKNINNVFTQISTTGLSWTSIDNTLTLLLMTNNSIMRLNPSTNTFYTIYTSPTAYSSSDTIWSNVLSNSNKIAIASLTSSNVSF